MAAFTDYKALDFSGLDAGIGRIANRFKENRENEAILKYLESQGGQKKEGTSLSNLDADYGKTETVSKPGKIENNPLPKLGVQVAENEEDTQRLEGQMAAGQGAFARPQAQQPQQQGTDLARLFSTKENEFGLPPGYLAKTAQVESGGNPGARNPNSSAAGLFQFIKPTAQQYGLQNPLDPVASTDAAARLAADNKRALTQALGREPTAGELYLAHQQGANGAVKLLANADAPAEAVVGPEAFRLNGGQPGMTAGQFASKWTSKIDGRGQQGGVQMAQAQGGPQADVPAQGAQQAQGFAIPQGMQPANRQNIDVQQLKGLIQAGGAAKALGLQLFQQAQTGRNFGFLTGPDGAIYRTDPRSGSMERLTEPTKTQQPVTVGEGQTLVDPRNGKVIYQGEAKRVDTPTMREYEYAKTQGFSGSLVDFERERAAAKARPPQATATDQKAIWASEDALPQLESTISSLSRARELNRQTYEGAGAGIKGQVGSSGIPVISGLFDQQKAKATREFGQLMSLESIKAMSETLKGATTDKEMARFMEILGDPSTPPEIRERTIDTMLNLAKRQKQLAEGRVDELRAKTGQPPLKRQPQGMEGARRAPDGNIYVPDPNRPGKYLMVQP